MILLDVIADGLRCWATGVTTGLSTDDQATIAQGYMRLAAIGVPRDVAEKAIARLADLAQMEPRVITLKDLFDELVRLVATGEAICKACGCTDSLGCPDGCWWAWRSGAVGLCSNCIP